MKPMKKFRNRLILSIVLFIIATVLTVLITAKTKKWELFLFPVGIISFLIEPSYRRYKDKKREVIFFSQQKEKGA